MKLTRIDKENGRSFMPYIITGSKNAEPDRIMIGATDDEDIAAGAISARIRDGIIDIASLYIVPAFRRQGYATALIGCLETMAKQAGDDMVVAEFIERDDAARFFDAMGYTLFHDKEQYYFYLGDLIRSKLYKKHIMNKKPEGLTIISNLPQIERNALEIELGFRDYDPEWSTVRMEGKKYSSVLLATCDDMTVSILFLESKTEDPSSILKHFAALVLKAEECYPGETELKFRMIFENVSLTKKMEDLLGGQGYLRQEGRRLSAIKFI